MPSLGFLQALCFELSKQPCAMRIINSFFSFFFFNEETGAQNGLVTWDHDKDKSLMISDEREEEG